MIRELVILLETMDYDELRDFIDYAEFFHLSVFANEDNLGGFLKSVRHRRAGLPTGGLPYMGEKLSKKLLRMTSSRQRAALAIVKKLEREWMMVMFGDPNDFQQRTRGTVAWALLRGKQPVRKGSQGTIQVKWISYKRRQRDPDGKPSVDKKGKPIYIILSQCYLYLRYWEIHGDDNRKKSQLRSMYIGGHLQGIAERMEGGYMFRDLTNLVWETFHYHRATNGRRSPSADSPIALLEGQIMTCIDMGKNPPQVDIGKLLDLQTALCGEEKEG
jgi:hypothetical protein